MPKWNFSLSGLRNGEIVGGSIFSENFIIYWSEQVLEESPDKSFTSAKLKPGTFVSMILKRNYNRSDTDRNQKIRSFQTKKINLSVISNFVCFRRRCYNSILYILICFYILFNSQLRFRCRLQESMTGNNGTFSFFRN